MDCNCSLEIGCIQVSSHYDSVFMKPMVAAVLACLGRLAIILGTEWPFLPWSWGPGAMVDELGDKLEKGLEGLGVCREKILFPLVVHPCVLPCLSQPLFLHLVAEDLRLTLCESMHDPQLAVSRVK